MVSFMFFSWMSRLICVFFLNRHSCAVPDMFYLFSWELAKFRDRNFVPGTFSDSFHNLVLSF